MGTPQPVHDYNAFAPRSRIPLILVSAALLAAWCAGLFARAYWTPDEPREADIAWRMSWQDGKAVPLLAGEAFCEKPPLAYWVAGAAMRAFGDTAGAARLPNLLYALVTGLAVGLLARRAAGPLAGLVAGGAMATFLLSYQVAIWLATDAPLLAASAVALLGAYSGFHARTSAERLRWYTLMHAALALGFLSKSAVAWMVPALALLTLATWERRWRELLRWELYAGLALQALVILAWVWAVYRGPDGVARLKVFFWNNLAGRFTRVDAPEALQYATAHRNTPGKYFIELPMYLWPWTLLVAAAARRAWLERRRGTEALRAVRFALACALPALALLSLAATARNIYLAPALPGFALLVGWWARAALERGDRWDIAAVRATAILVLVAAAAFAAALAIVGTEWLEHPLFDLAIAGVALIAAAGLALRAALAGRAAARAGQALPARAAPAGSITSAERAPRLVVAASAERPAAPARAALPGALLALLASYCLLISVPAAALYRSVDAWQDLASIGRAVRADAAGRPLILMAPDETTRAFIDMFTRPDVELVPGPADAAAIARLRERLASLPTALVVAQLPGRELVGSLRRLAERFPHATAREPEGEPGWILAARLRVLHRYALPNGRRYALLEP
jgi:4-amino-4-deoxy-L-arabinose transferase-like glycosyltransferase